MAFAKMWQVRVPAGTRVVCLDLGINISEKEILENAIVDAFRRIGVEGGLEGLFIEIKDKERILVADFVSRAGRRICVNLPAQICEPTTLYDPYMDIIENCIASAIGAPSI